MHHDGFANRGFAMGFGHGILGIIFWIILLAVIVYIIKDVFGKK